MAVIAVINRKGGVGKSTVATHIAGYLARQGADVMLGDVDKQQSSRMWLTLRPATQPKIQGWSIDERNFARPPAGVKHIVLDTPSGFNGMGLMKVAMYADAIIIPSSHSIFDRASAGECLNDLRHITRIVSGKCRLACLGVRIDSRTHNGRDLGIWAAENSLEYLGSIKAAQAYSRCMELGLTLFDYPAEKVQSYVSEWSGVIRLLDEIMTQTVERAPESMASGTDPRIRRIIPDVPSYLQR